MVLVYKRRQKDLFHVNIGENQDGFVLLSSVYHRRISVFTKSAKYEVSVYRPGGEVNSTIYCSDIN